MWSRIHWKIWIIHAIIVHGVLGDYTQESRHGWTLHEKLGHGWIDWHIAVDVVLGLGGSGNGIIGRGTRIHSLRFIMLFAIAQHIWNLVLCGKIEFLVHVSK